VRRGRPLAGLSDAQPMLGGRYQVSAARNLCAPEDGPSLVRVLLDVWDGRMTSVATIELMPDEARELARRLRGAAAVVEQASKR
jgi:hypothetical protein